MNRQTLVAAVLMLGSAGGLVDMAVAAEPVIPPKLVADSTEGQPTPADKPITFTFDALPASGRLHVLLGTTDITGLMRQSAPNALSYPADEMALPPGEVVVVVSYEADDGTLTEVARFPLAITAVDNAARGDRQRASNVGLTVARGVTRTHQESSAAPSAIVRQPESTLQGGVQLTAPLGGGTVAGTAQIAGSTQRSKALNPSAGGGNAPSVDLAAYTLEWRNESTAIGLGASHFAAQHPLLWQGASNRGVFVTQKLGDRMDFGVAAQNATPIVGADNLLGIYRGIHHFAAAVLGFEFTPARPRALRLELIGVDAAESMPLPPTFLAQPASSTLASSTLRPCTDAAQQQQQTMSLAPSCDVNQAPFNGNQSASSQSSRSRGVGARLMGQSDDQRLRGEFAYAVSRSEDLANALTPATEAKSHRAMVGDINYDIVKQRMLRDYGPLTMTAAAKYEYAEPSFRSLASQWQADFRQTTLALVANIATASAQLSAQSRFDNVNGDSVRLRNRIRIQALTITTPLAQMLTAPGATANPWLPSVAINAQRGKIFASDIPADVMPANVPNATNNSLSALLNWGTERWTAGYGYTEIRQDNQQIGSEDRDQTNVTHSISGSLRLTDALNVSISVAPTRTTALDTGVVTERVPTQLSVNWIAPGSFTLSGSYSFERGRSSDGLGHHKVWGLNTVLGMDFKLRLWGDRPRPGQIQLRHSLNSFNSSATDPFFQTPTTAMQRASVVMLTVSLSLF